MQLFSRRFNYMLSRLKDIKKNSNVFKFKLKFSNNKRPRNRQTCSSKTFQFPNVRVSQPVSRDLKICSKYGDVRNTEMFEIRRCLEYGDVWNTEMFEISRCSEYGDVRNMEMFGIRRCSKYGDVRNTEMFGIRRCLEYGDVWNTEMFGDSKSQLRHKQGNLSSYFLWFFCFVFYIFKLYYCIKFNNFII